jgi:hypothetical protein
MKIGKKVWWISGKWGAANLGVHEGIVCGIEV